MLVFMAGCATRPTQTGREPRTVDLPSARQEAHEPGLPEAAFQAFALVGTPYKWGGNTPESGFDCSGLIGWVMRSTLGIQLPRTAHEIAQRGQKIDLEDRLPGDLVFFNTRGGRYSHAGIYLGQNRFVHAPSRGGTVRLEQLDSEYWAKRFTGVRRLSS